MLFFLHGSLEFSQIPFRNFNERTLIKSFQHTSCTFLLNLIDPVVQKIIKVLNQNCSKLFIWNVSYLIYENLHIGGL